MAADSFAFYDKGDHAQGLDDALDPDALMAILIADDRGVHDDGPLWIRAATDGASSAPAAMDPADAAIAAFPDICFTPPDALY